MANKEVTITVRLRARPGMAAHLRQAGQSLVAPTRSEAGCISYHFHEDANDLGLFLFYERWTNQQALEAHLNTSYLIEFRKVLDEVLAEPFEVIFWRPIAPEQKH